MSEPEKTPWFSPDVRPVRSGWYERLYNDGTIARDWWSDNKSACAGGAWCVSVNGFLVPADGGLPWRGIVR